MFIFRYFSHSPPRPWPCSPSGKHGQLSWNAGPKPATVAIAVTAIVAEAVEEAIVNARGAIVLAGTTIKTRAARLNDRPKMIPSVRTQRRAAIPQIARVGADVVEAVAVLAMAGVTRNLNRRRANESPSCRFRI